MTLPKVSVIIPIYNVEKYLSECVESVINQTLKEIEIILIDDGSTDTSPSICDKYQKKDSRIKVIHKSNGGLSNARNTGLKLAQGEYISFVDADDWIASEMLSKMYLKAKQEHSDVTICNLSIAKNKKIKPTQYWPQINEHIIYKDEIYSHLFLHPSYVVNKIYKRTFLEKNKLYFLQGYIYEDVPFSTQVLLLTNHISYCLDNFYFYRLERDDAITAKKSTKHLDIIYIEQQIQEILNKHNVPDNVWKNFYQWQTEIYTWMYKLLPDSSKQLAIQAINNLPSQTQKEIYTKLNTNKYKLILFKKITLLSFKTQHSDKIERVANLFTPLLTIKKV